MAPTDVGIAVKRDRCGVPNFCNGAQTNIGGHTDKHCPEMIEAIRKYMRPVMDKHIQAMSDELKEVVGPPYNLDDYFEKAGEPTEEEST